jgi:hypothetical protein
MKLSLVVLGLFFASLQSFGTDFSCSDKNGLLITTTSNPQTPFQSVQVSTTGASLMGDFYGYSNPLYQKDSVTKELVQVVNANQIANHAVSTLTLLIILETPTTGQGKAVIFDGIQTMVFDHLKCGPKN